MAGQNDWWLYPIAKIQNDIISPIKAFLKTPDADSEADELARDVIGSKDDTTAGTSIVARAKSIIGLHGVPDPDGSVNTNVRDVVGNRSDANTTTTLAGRALKAAEMLDTVDGKADTIDGKADTINTNVESVDSTVDLLQKYTFGASRVLPSLGGGIVVTADATAWVLGDLSAAVIPDEVNEVALLTILQSASQDGEVTINLDGESFGVAITEGDENAVALEIRNATFTGWTTGGADAIVTFTADTAGSKLQASYEAGATGAEGQMLTTKKGHGDKFFTIDGINVEAASANAVYEIILYGGDEELARTKVQKTAAMDKMDFVPIKTPLIPPETVIAARVACSETTDQNVTVSLLFHEYDLPGG